MILGGSRYILPVIEAAHKLEVEVITADYLPNNIAHQFSDSYVNVSIIKKEDVLRVAHDLQIDGIMSFAADPGVVTAAYVAEKMKLPFQCSYQTALILQNKDKFREFLATNGFNVPKSIMIDDQDSAKEKVEKIGYPVIVKPVDLAGSKGVVKVDTPRKLGSAVKMAIEQSLKKRCIVEEFIDKKKDPSDSDCFTINGAFDCISFTDQKFDSYANNPYVPSAYVLPNSYTTSERQEIMRDLQRLSDLLNLKTGIYNIETRIGTNNKPYIMEVSPRGGGNRLSEFLRYATGVDLISASVKAALGEDIHKIGNPQFGAECWYQMILHSNTKGRFEKLIIDPAFEAAHIVDVQIWVDKGDEINSFDGANNAFGTVIMKFSSQEEMNSYTANLNHWIKIVLK